MENNLRQAKNFLYDLFKGHEQTKAAVNNPVTGFSCPVCKNINVEFSPLPFHYYKEMDKHEFVHSIFLFETLNIEFYTCNICNANDRSRLYALFISGKIQGLTGGETLRVLDIAPAPPLTNFLKKQTQLSIRTADLNMEGVDDHVDLTKMDIYPDNSFDAFICSHVLEHVDEDQKAMNELYRILRPDGWGIAMVPIHLGLKEDHEDAALESESDRWKYFGQNDHVRLYSKKGFVDKLEKAGFIVQQLGIQYFGEEISYKNGIHPRSVLYIVSK